MGTVAAGTEIFSQAGFTDAKRHLSDLMDGIVHQHRPVQVNRHRGKEQMLMVSSGQLLEVLESVGQRFDARVSIDEDETAVSLPAFGLIGAGDTFDDAVDDLVEVLREYCAQYLRRIDFYRQTDRRGLLPLVFLFALTPAEQQRDLLLRPPANAPAAA